jgi:TonB family protein
MFFTNLLHAQYAIIDSICKCFHQSQLKYPIDETGISGTVIIEFEMDSSGYLSNPLVIQSVGKKFDDEALRVINEQILFLNRCRHNCKNKRKQTPNKLKQPITFTSSDE